MTKFRIDERQPSGPCQVYYFSEKLSSIQTLFWSLQGAHLFVWLQLLLVGEVRLSNFYSVAPPVVFVVETLRLLFTTCLISPKPRNPWGAWVWLGSAATLHWAESLMQDWAEEQKSVSELKVRPSVKSKYYHL